MLARALLALSLLSATGALAAPLASAFGPQAPWAEPSGGYVGRLKVTPEHAPSGTLLTVTAEGLPAEQEFDLVWRTVTGTWRVANAEYHGREYTPVAYHIAKVKADIAGRATTTFTAPEDYGFNHDVVLQQGVRLFTQAGFNLDMTVKLSPESGPPGTPITVEVKGIGWRHLQNSYVLLYDNNFTGWMSAVTTGGSANFTIPATGKPGVHVLELLHADFTFPYRNMQQSPEPDRPRFALQFSVTPDSAVLPPPPRTTGAGERPRAPRTGRTRRLTAVFSRRSAGRGEQHRFRGGRELSAQLDHGDRQPRGGRRRRLGGIVQSHRGEQGRRLRPDGVSLQYARRSRRHTWILVGRGYRQENGDALHRAKRIAARRGPRAGRYYVQAST